MTRLRVVIDSDTLAPGLVTKASPAAGVVRAWRLGIFDLLRTGTSIDEVARTLSRLRIDEVRIQQLVDALCSEPDFIVGILHQDLGCTQEKDNHLFEAAIVGCASIIVSRDAHVLDPPPHVAVLLRRHRVSVMNPAQFLEYLDRSVFSPLLPCVVRLGDLVPLPGYDCALCGHEYHWDLPCRETWIGATGDFPDCPCFEAPVTA